MDKEILEYCKRVFPNNDFFEFDGTKRLKTASSNVHNKPGVYLFFSLDSDGAKKLVYIGKSGTMQKNGAFQGQFLRGRINNVQEDSKRREDFFIEKITEPDCEKIIVQWFVTFNDRIQLLPAYVEAKLLQMYYRENKTLPEWNKKF